MLAILDYGAGNLTSVRLAFERLGAAVVVAETAAEADRADRLVFPGVGSAASGMQGIRARGFDGLLRRAATQQRPILGICLGMQLLLDRSAEDGDQEALGLIPGQVVPFQFPAQQRIKIPQMGWNSVCFTSPHPVWQGLDSGEAFYFVHSYYAVPAQAGLTCGQSDYAGLEFTSAVALSSIFATQFHPERSGDCGLQLLKNFLNWDGILAC
ncbi:MAG: imidazole glycerol phosphate synthase subunit HisH [Lentisphaeria bacterium]